MMSMISERYCVKQILLMAHTLHCINVISIENRADCLLVCLLWESNRAKWKKVYAASNHSQIRNETQFQKVKIKLWARVTVKRVVCVRVRCFCMSNIRDRFRFCLSVVVVCQSIFNQLIVDVVKVKELWWYVNIIISLILSFSLKSRTTNEIPLKLRFGHTSHWSYRLKSKILCACSYFLICSV